MSNGVPVIVYILGFMCVARKASCMPLTFLFPMRPLALILTGCLVASLLTSATGVAVASDSASESYTQGVNALRSEQWKSAASFFEETLKLDSHRADAANGLGVALGKLGNLEGSQDAFRRAIAIDPTYAEPHFNLAQWL